MGLLEFLRADRILTVIAGAGMDLETAQGILSADLNRPVKFDVALEVHSKLKDGPIQDLNLMFDPQRCYGDVTSIRGRFSLILGSDPHLMLAVLCTKGSVGVDEVTQLKQGATALISPRTIPFNLGKTASAILVMVTSAIN